MLINLRNALMTGKRLPYDAEVEYLESTGTQYIDTGLNADSSLGYDITSSITNYSQSYDQPFGVLHRNPIISHHFGNVTTVNPNALAILLGDGSNFIVQKPEGASGEIVRWIVDTVNRTASIDNVSGSWSGVSSFDTGLSFYLFGRHDSSSDRLISARCYSARFYVSGVLVRDFIPVRKGTVGALYDRRGVGGMNPDGSPRNDGMYYNVGTGDFQYGQDVVPVEWLGFTGTQYIYTGFDITNATSFAYEIKYDLAETITNAEPRIISNEGAGSRAYYDIYYSLERDKLYVRQSGKSISPIRNKPIVSIMTEQGRYYGYYEESPQSLLYDGARAFVAPTTVQQYKIGARANSGQDQYKHEGRIYYGLFTKDGSPAKRFYSVRVGTEGAMMDVLTRRIYRNAGTGAFTYGNDLKYPISAT